MTVSLTERPVPSVDDAQVTEPVIFANARLVLPDRVILGQLTVLGDRIAEIAEGADVPAGALDLNGDLLAPGLIELHTDNLERHIEPRPKVAWPHGPAIVAHDAELASCGITTVFDAMRVGSIPRGKGRYLKYARPLASELLELRASGALRISHFLHLRAEICSETLIEELAEFGAEDRVGIVSLMDHTPGQRQFRDVSKLKDYIQGKHGMSDAEFDDHVDRLRTLREAHGDRHEAMAVAEARRFGAILASHDDTTGDQVGVSASYGVRLAEFPTTEEAAAACHEAGIAVMMGAPNLIRGGSHSGNVSAKVLAEAGHLDIVSSDYVPSALLTAAFRLAELWSDLPRAIRTVTSAPAEATGLTDRGALVEGHRADLIRLAEIAAQPIVRETWVAGRRVA